MNNDSTKNQLDVSEIAEITSELHEGRLSRRGLSDRLKGLGLGFGAAFVLGMTGAQAATAPDATVVLKSNNPARERSSSKTARNPARLRPMAARCSSWRGSAAISIASSIAGIAAGDRHSRNRYRFRVTKRPRLESRALFSIPR